MIDSGKTLIITKDIKDYIIPLSDDEFAQLEKNILEEGCRDHLVVWQKSENELILIDGHNRYKICQRSNIPFKIKKLQFSDLEEVKIWMVDNQMGRRNLDPDQMSYYRGLKYLSLKNKKGGYKNVKSKGQSESSTSALLAIQFKVSESTVKRDAKFSKGLEIIAKTNPKLKTKILTGETKVKKADIQILAEAKNVDKLKIKNEADLFNKAKIIRKEVLDEVENEVKKVRNERVEKAKSILKSLEPVFSVQTDRLMTIKGMIVSEINHAINERNVNSIKKLKKLVERLERELFD